MDTVNAWLETAPPRSQCPHDVPQAAATLVLTRDLPVPAHEEILAGSLLCYQFSLGSRRSPECSYWHWYGVQFSPLILHLHHLQASLQVNIRDGHVIHCILAFGFDDIVILLTIDHTLLFSSTFTYIPFFAKLSKCRSHWFLCWPPAHLLLQPPPSPLGLPTRQAALLSPLASSGATTPPATARPLSMQSRA